MTFVESITTCFSKYATFRGRASRAEYWWWVLFCVVGQVVLGELDHRWGGLFALATLLPYIAVATRRLHDTDRSGWFQLVGFIPLIGWLVLIYWCVQDSQEPNRFNG